MARAPRQAVEPDYTKGEKLLDDLNYVSLGPIGAFGNLWSMGFDDPTANTRMIQIRAVKKGTRAEGVLNAGDVILGVISPAADGTAKPDARFDDNARKALSAAITEAEKNEHNGKLVLNVWRMATGTCEPVTIMLPVMGSYSATSPWACEKTRTIIDAACQSILDRGFQRYDESLETGIPTLLDALGLLATGEEKYLPQVQTYARALADCCTSLDIMSDGQGDKGVGAWDGAYRNILLTEYYLATRDEQVLPGIIALSTYLALGQSGVGTWSHGMADVRLNGPYGPPGSYGAMNQCSLTCAISLVLARKCGISKPEIDDAVNRSLNFYRWYVDKGTVPYGDHAPALCHDNNGRSSQAAVFFDLAGDKNAADFFTRMTLASYAEREDGHTGNYFSWLWGALGAARGGPEAAQSFIRHTRWYTELERRPDAGSVYQFALHRQEHAKYHNWITTGSRLLQHCLPRKKLYLTGKDGSSIAPLAGAELESVAAAGEFDPTGLAASQLLEALGSWSPVVRLMAGEALGHRDEDVVKELIAMLDSPNRYARYGACGGLCHAGRGSREAVAALLGKLKDARDMTLRYYAVIGLRKSKPPVETQGGEAVAAWKKSLASGGAMDEAIPVLLKLAATCEPERDPLRKLHNEIAETLFSEAKSLKYQGYLPGGRGIGKLDPAIVVPAVKSLLLNPNGRARTTVSDCYDDLSAKELEALWGDIYYATKYQAPSGVMFSGGVRSKGMELMARHHVKEGIAVGVDYALRQEGWGNKARKTNGIPPLLSYGKALEDYVPEITPILEKWRGEKSGSKNNPEDAADFKKRLAEALRMPTPALISIKPYIDATPDPVESARKK